MKYFETKHEKDSARITVLVGIILLLLIFIAGPSYLDPPKEYGVAVNFGSTLNGLGKTQPTKLMDAEVQKVIEIPDIQEPTPKQDNSLPKKSQEEVLTNDNNERIVINNKKEDEHKKVREEVKIKKENDHLLKEQKIKEEKKKKLDDLIGGIGKANEKKPEGLGDDNVIGDKGQLIGNPYAPSYFGELGNGSKGKDYGLNGRGNPTKSKIFPKCDEEGRVVVQIRVNRIGDVVSASPGKEEQQALFVFLRLQNRQP